MKNKWILLLFICMFFLVGCTNINKLSYDDVVNTLSVIDRKSNVYKKGFDFYMPMGLQIEDAGNNYVIFSSNRYNYYLYVDMISYINKKEIKYEKNDKALYSEKIEYDNKSGYVEINLWENNKYLIEIMYNYAKIEVMVDSDDIKVALLKSINILKSVKYKDIAINNMLNDDNLDSTEEIFNMFKNAKKNDSTLTSDGDVVEQDKVSEEVKDTDFIE